MAQKKGRFLTGSPTVANIPGLRKLPVEERKLKDYPKPANPVHTTFPTGGVSFRSNTQI